MAFAHGGCMAITQTSRNMKLSMKGFLKSDLFQSFVVFLIFILLLLSSCAGPEMQGAKSAPGYAPPSGPAAQPAGKNDQLNLELARKGAGLNRAFSVADYKVGPEDLLDIDVFQVPDLKGTVRVSARGFIKLPLTDTLQVAGLTVAELESFISNRLAKYVKEPVVSVFVREYRSQQISVLGSVKDPRMYYATGQKYVLDMLSMAGGLTSDAGTVCIIQRSASSDPSGTGAPPEKIVIDLNKLLVEGNADLNIPVFGGDIVHIPKSGIFFVDGAIRGSGEYNLKGRTTLTQAISMAKGFDESASLSDIRIFRDTGKPEREVLTLDYDSVLNGASTDIEIKDKDIIIVSSSAFKRFFSKLSGAIGLGMFRVGGIGF